MNKKSLTFNKGTLLAMPLLTLLIMFSSQSFAGLTTKHVIEQVVKTYGVAKLKSLHITDQYNTFREGQSYSPDEIDIEDNRVELSIDLMKKRKNFKWIIGDKGNYSVRHWLFNGEHGYAISHASKTMAKSDMVSFDFADRKHSYLFDTVIVSMIRENQHEISEYSEVSLRGELHFKLVMTGLRNDELAIYINKASGYVTYMEVLTNNAKRMLRYHYNNHILMQGFVFAQRAHATQGGKPYSLVTNRQVSFNHVADNDFTLPEQFGESAASADMSAMTVKKISEGVYHVGQDWGYSVFVDIGDGFISAGGYEAITERFEAVKAFAHVNKPLKYQVVSHHHSDHIRGMNEAAKLGAKFVTVKQHVNSVKAVVDSQLTDDDFHIVEQQAILANGKVMVIDMPSSHSSHNLMTYIPAAKLLFTADTYFSRQLDGVPFGGAHLKKIDDRLKALNLPVEKFSAAHSARLLTADDFSTSITKTLEPICPDSWNICQLMMAN